MTSEAAIIKSAYEPHFGWQVRVIFTNMLGDG